MPQKFKSKHQNTVPKRMYGHVLVKYPRQIFDVSRSNITDEISDIFETLSIAPRNNNSNHRSINDIEFSTRDDVTNKEFYATRRSINNKGDFIG